MARIRHVAFYTEDPERAADFYCRAFDLKRLRQSENGSIWISDGYINVALIKRSKSTGIDHIGFLVENLESAQKRLREVVPENAAHALELRMQKPGAQANPSSHLPAATGSP